MMESKDGFTGPVNIGNPEEFTMLQLAERIIDLTQSKSQVVFAPLPQDDPMQRKPDITLVKQELKWMPHINLEDGLMKTIKYFENKLEKDE